jgi:hypothetical protein
MPQTTLIGVKEAASILGITPRAVRHRVLAGTLTPIQKLPGQTGSYVFDRAEVLAAKDAA